MNVLYAQYFLLVGTGQWQGLSLRQGGAGAEALARGQDTGRERVRGLSRGTGRGLRRGQTGA